MVNRHAAAGFLKMENMIMPMQSVDTIRDEIVKKAWKMAFALCKGKDLEIRKSVKGITVAEVTKKVQKND